MSRYSDSDGRRPVLVRVLAKVVGGCNPPFPPIPPTPPTPPADLAGIQAQLVGSPSTIVAASAPIIFDTVLTATTSAISYNPATGVFTISTPGTYLVNWWVATDGSEGALTLSFSLNVNGGTGILGSSPLQTGQVVGSALITVASLPTTVTLTNASGVSILLALTPVQANIVITGVDD